MKDKVSVITVNYNCASDLENTINSVVNQTYSNIEYIIVDGGSNDGSVEVIKKYEANITKWISEPDKGIYDAMNKAIEMASGTWLNFMNTGDVYADMNVLSNIFQKEYPDSVGFIYSDYLYKKQNGDLEVRPQSREKGDILHQSSIYRKELHKKHGYYIVTHPYIISDMLFFLSIPNVLFYKTSTIISINKAGGISDEGEWCREQALCLKVVFGMENINQIFSLFIKKNIKKLIFYKHIKRLL